VGGFYSEVAVNSFDDDIYENMNDDDMMYTSLLTCDSHTQSEMASESIKEAENILRGWRGGEVMVEAGQSDFDNGSDFVSLITSAQEQSKLRWKAPKTEKDPQC